MSYGFPGSAHPDTPVGDSEALDDKQGANPIPRENPESEQSGR